MGGPGTMISPNFYPRSPCGERRSEGTTATSRATFLSTLSLRRATVFVRCAAAGKIFLSTLSLRRATGASAHAHLPIFDFYPRSPCGERRTAANEAATTANISIHALLAESDISVLWMVRSHPSFLSTLSLRRATSSGFNVRSIGEDFYPRSPCRERLRATTLEEVILYFYPRSPCGERRLAPRA